MLGRWVDSPQRGDRNPPSQSIPALKGDDGQLVRICGTVTRAGPVKAGMFWKSWRSEWRRGTVVTSQKCLFVDVHGVLFSSLLQFGNILIQIWYFSQILWEIEIFPVFLLWPTSIIVAQKTPKKRKKNTDDGRSLPVTWLVTGDIAWRKSWNGLPGISCCTRCTDSKM